MSPPNARSRPGEEAAHVVQVTQRKVNAEITPEAPDLREATRWALTMVGQLGVVDPPLFASAEWVAAQGPTRLASALRAACAYAQDRDPHVLAARHDLEMQAAWRAAEEDYDGWKTLAGRIRASANQPTFDELQRRRAS